MLKLKRRPTKKYIVHGIAGTIMGLITFIITEFPKFDWNFRPYVEVKTNYKFESKMEFEDVYSIIITGKEKRKKHIKSLEDQTKTLYTFSKLIGAQDTNIYVINANDTIDMTLISKVFEDVERKSDLNDLIIVAYSGHGVKIENGEEHAALYIDKNFLLFPSTIKDLINDAKYNLCMYIMDACFSGDFASTLADEKSVIITSSSKRKYAMFFSEFIENFIDAYNSNDADLNYDKKISLLELFRYAATHDFYSTTKFPPLKQTPHLFYPNGFKPDSFFIFYYE